MIISRRFEGYDAHEPRSAGFGPQSGPSQQEQRRADQRQLDGARAPKPHQRTSGHGGGNAGDVCAQATRSVHANDDDVSDGPGPA